MNADQNIKRELLNRQNNLLVSMIIVNNINKFDQAYLKRLILKSIENMSEDEKLTLGTYLDSMNGDGKL